MVQGKASSKRGKRASKTTKVSRLRKPEEMSLEQWQIALRRQLAEKQDFSFENAGVEPIFSEFLVTNPQTGGEYRVAIRGLRLTRSSQGLGASGRFRLETEKPVIPALGLPPRPVAPSSRISPPEPVAAPGNGEIAVG